jgi:hypothetical protein
MTSPQRPVIHAEDGAMAPMIAICLALLVVSTLVHYEALRGLGFALPRLRLPGRNKLVLVILGSSVAHALEGLLYALAFYLLSGRFGLGSLGSGDAPSLATCLYFSAETYTSLGYGDVVPVGPLRMLAGTEALNGLLLIGWSASYTYLAMERFWNAEGDGRTP